MIYVLDYRIIELNQVYKEFLNKNNAREWIDGRIVC
jgi:hypothetical protein